jgi:hypothetical protein
MGEQWLPETGKNEGVIDEYNIIILYNEYVWCSMIEYTVYK